MRRVVLLAATAAALVAGGLTASASAAVAASLPQQPAVPVCVTTDPLIVLGYEVLPGEQVCVPPS